jgi:hypothetical protein
MLTIRRSKPLSELDRGEACEAQDTLSAAQVARFSVMFGLDGKVVPARAAGALLAHVITTRFPGPGSRIIAENLRYGGIMAEARRAAMMLRHRASAALSAALTTLPVSCGTC